MEDALDGMFDIITGHTEYVPPCEPTVTSIVPTDTDEAANERAAIDELLGIQPQPVNIEPKPIMIEVYPFDPDGNMVVESIREEFKNEVIFRETDIFTAPEITTITMEGFLSNVNCHEEDLIADLEADEEFVRIKCNFGEKVYPGYIPPIKTKKSNRGRKKKPPKVHKRKQQGTGECFNSQTTFVMPSTKTVITDGKVPTDATIYKFKVFRTGKIQLPGLRTTTVIDDVMELTKRLVLLLNFHLHTCETDITKLTKLINLNPVMKNYKLRTKLKENWIIDLATLRQLLHMNRNPGGDCPKIFDVKYTRQQTKLSVQFSTPVYGNIKKRVRVNIFQSGKINILGGHSKQTTDAICEFIHDLFKQNQSTIFTKLGSVDNQLEDNIVCGEVKYVDTIMVPIPVINMSAEQYEEVQAIINTYYEKFIADVNSEISNALGI
jgi:hypothetical protein